MSAMAFADPAFESQAAFRAILRAIASPGAIEPCGRGLKPPSPLSPAAAAAILTLADFETPLWIAPSLAEWGEAAAYLKFHTGAPLAASPREVIESGLTDRVLDDPQTPYAQLLVSSVLAV
jgi:alpha-D-ribose 1-methylphosphonate 5-triphosphate synthase subunit PhnH